MNEWSVHDEQMMARAVEIAQSGRGYTLGNPRVGAVISRGGNIIAEGYHQRFGGLHAERNALAEAKRRGRDLRQATMYVTLEPCCHYGKTGPCTEAIIESGIRRVVVGTLDPNPTVHGKGIARLRDAGISVTSGLLEGECRALNPAFNTFHTLRRPYVILKWAQSVDGFIDMQRPPSAPAPWLTGNHGRLVVHRWRSECMAILVGANTVLRDNPQLNVRAWVGPQPLRVVVDRNLSLSNGFHIFDGSQPSLILTNRKDEDSAEWKKLEKIPQLEVSTLNEQLSLPAAVLQALYERKINSLLVEGGAKTITQFIESNLWDEARVFIAPRAFGNGVKAPAIPSGPCKTFTVGSSTLMQIHNTRPSAIVSPLSNEQQI